MRAIFTKAVAGSLIAGAALMVSACGSKTTNESDNTTVTDMNATEGMDTMSDNMTSVDGANGSGAMANDSMSNGSMMSNDTMMSNSSGNAM